MAKNDYYKILGVNRNATEEDIKKAYRQMALKHHPDRNPGVKESEQKFKDAAEAYEVLGDTEKKQRYDQFGHDGLRGAEMHGFNTFEDIFDAFGDIFGGSSVFEDLFGAGRSRRRGPHRGASLKCDIEVDFVEVAKGVEKTIELTRKEPCDKCNGTGARHGTRPAACSYCGGRGEVQQSRGFFTLRTTCPKCSGKGTVIESPCNKCSGAGRYPKKTSISVQIPAGVDDGMRLRIPGQGEAGENGAPRGDLYCDIHIRPHPIFNRHNNDIICEVPITFTQAALGAVIDVPTIANTTRIKIPRGTQSGHVLRIRGEGFPDVHGYGRGNLLIHLVIETPIRLTARQEELLSEFAELEQRNPGPRKKGFFEKMKDYF
ncbi:MAG: molecular chaperone DnaJ [Candidatus Brocadiales bacterium]